MVVSQISYFFIPAQNLLCFKDIDMIGMLCTCTLRRSCQKQVWANGNFDFYFFSQATVDVKFMP